MNVKPIFAALQPAKQNAFREDGRSVIGGGADIH